MKQLNLALVTLGLALAGCDNRTEAATQTTAIAQAEALEKQADVQEAVGDKAGAKEMRDKAAALRAQQ